MLGCPSRDAGGGPDAWERAVLRLAGLPCVGPVREEIGARCAAIGVRPLVTDSGAKRTGGGVASAAAVRWVCRWEKARPHGRLESLARGAGLLSTLVREALAVPSR